MNGIEITDVHQWQPLRWFGLEHPFFSINASIITYTWIALLVLVLILLPIRWFLQKKSGIIYFIITSLTTASMQFVAQALGTFSAAHFYFIGTIFIFIFLCNILSIIPFVEEPTRDLNTTLALGIITFLYTQTYAIKTNGFKIYMKEFFAPFFLMFPLNIVGKLATIVSISFRLFGNIFGGAIIMTILNNFLKKHVLIEIIALITGINLTVQLFFGLFESLIQAFVFTMLSLTYLSIATQKEEENF